MKNGNETSALTDRSPPFADWKVLDALDASVEACIVEVVFAAVRWRRGRRGRLLNHEMTSKS